MFSAPLRASASARLAELVRQKKNEIIKTAAASVSSSSAAESSKKSSSKGFYSRAHDISLELPDGTSTPGFRFGHNSSKAGELVFSTGMVGYAEAMTDPSYRGQILTFTYPMIGNYGVPPKEYDELGLLKYFESERIQVQGIVVQEYSREWSHCLGVRSLSDWMTEEQVPGISGVDTRHLTTRIRETGAMLAKLDIGGAELRFDDPNKRNLVAEVSINEPRIYGNGDVKLIAVDCGIKNNIIRQLAVRGATVKVVPWDYDFNKEDYDGLFISNGPGDPSMALTTINHLRQALATSNKPIFGICLGNQLLAIAAGASTYKLPYGNRGQNQPCMDTLTGRCLISSQNHGFAVDAKTLPPEWTEYFVNLNDGSNEGIIHKTKPFFTVQFHPEAKNGPTDPEYLFDMFIQKVRDYKADPTNSTFYIPPLPRPDPPRVRKVLMLGSGGLQIGQAGEFDYSGSQAIKALKQEGIRSVLINPNIATVQTQAGLADAVYFAPLTMESIEEVIRKERPEGLFLGFGGQTALNLGVQMEQTGLLKRYGMKVLGTQVDAIMNAEDRELFNARLAEIGVKVAESFACTEIEDAVVAANKIGYPVMVRAAYALGGLGSGFCNNDEEIRSRCRQALACCPQVLVEKSLKGWKECEYEVVRDMYGNTVTVCNMENFDPMGIHTGESIVVAPSQTLSDDDYHWLREIAIKTVNHLKVVGECNIQYTYDPNSRDYRVIEINPRLSRSSALASKATGYPLAYVAAKLALGIPLPDLRNSVTKTTSADFEPSLDYIVTKLPRWDMLKFPHVDRHIGSAMKSVGEVMAVGRNFEESFQKAIRMVDSSYTGFEQRNWGSKTEHELLDELQNPTDQRVFALKEAFNRGYTVDQLHELTRITTWFLHKLAHIHELEGEVKSFKGKQLPANLLLAAKQHGFSDRQIGQLIGQSELDVRAYRKALKILPCTKQIDTQAAEFPAATNYLYMTYNASTDDLPKNEGAANGVIVLGSGTYRIGSSVEFDYGSVGVARALRAMGEKVMIVNFNPETVSTDYDESDALFFEELSLERVLDIVDRENPKGVVVSVGGQLPQNIALKLHECGVRVLGTSPIQIDRAEDRYKFSQMLDRLGVDQPEWKELTSKEEAMEFASKVNYPVLVRPSYVLSGAAMNVVHNDHDLWELLSEAASVSPDHPVVMTKFYLNSKELEIDAVCQNGKIVNWATSEHVEFAGVHSGDATLMFPSKYITQEVKDRIFEISEKITQELQVSGPVNVQYLFTPEGDLKVIECNLRASRSLPFMTKTLGVPMIDNLARVFMGKEVRKDERCRREVPFSGVKASMFSFQRLKGADPRLTVEMASTGEVACYGKNVHEAFLKAFLSSSFKWPKNKTLLAASLTDDLARELRTLTGYGYRVFTIPATAEKAEQFGIPHVTIPNEDILEFLSNKGADFVINWPLSLVHEDPFYYQMRRKAADFALPVVMNDRVAKMLVESLCHIKAESDIPTENFDYYHSLYP